jgi:hypothetical protein
MPRWRDSNESDDDPGIVYDPEDIDWPEEEDKDPTVPCPYCHREILEEAERCPYCESYISREDAPAARKPWWIVVGVIVCLYVVYRWNVWW